MSFLLPNVPNVKRLCCTVGFTETNLAVCLSARALIAGRHFAHVQLLGVTFIESTMSQRRMVEPLYQILLVPRRCVPTDFRP